MGRNRRSYPEDFKHRMVVLVRLLIPTEVVRLFRGKPSTDSDASRPPVPGASVRSFRPMPSGG